MTFAPKHFTVVDPRTAAGDPFEVAERAVAQLEGLLFIIQEQYEAAFILARNAGLERQLAGGEEPDPHAWYRTPEGDRWLALKTDIETQLTVLRQLKRAASFNPSAPLPAQDK